MCGGGGGVTRSRSFQPVSVSLGTVLGTLASVTVELVWTATYLEVRTGMSHLFVNHACMESYR